MEESGRKNGQELGEALVCGRCDLRQANLALWAAKGAAQGESEAEAHKALEWLNTRTAWLLENFRTDVAHLRSIGLWPVEWGNGNPDAGPAHGPCNGETQHEEDREWTH